MLKKGIISYYVRAYKTACILILTLVCNTIQSQNFIKANEWKRYKREVYIAVGASNFLGDLGGRDRIGTDNSPVDLELNQTASAFGLGYKYKILKWLNIGIGFNYLKLKGDDKLTKEPFRNNRNLNFKSNVFELGGRIELVYMHNNVGNRYGLKKTKKRRKKTNAYDITGFFGIGGFYFNPKGKDQSGKYIPLKPLHTEGQGLPNGPKQYSSYALCIPMGVCFKYYVNRKWAIGLELNYRKTFTDYIDDVSTTYYDKTALLNAYGATAVKMSDPSLGKVGGATSPDADGRQAQRGDVDKDSYLSLQVTLGYMIKKKYKKRRRRINSKF